MSVATIEGASDPLASMSRTTPEREGAAAWPDPPFSVGRYVVTAPLGRGAAGVVYRGYDPELERAVAIKLVTPRSRSDRLRERLLNEAQAIARLSHPNVVAVHDVGTLVMPAQDGQPLAMSVYMVLELVEGVTLRRWLRATTRRWTEVLDVLLAAGRGLEAAHRAGLVHRDFKPDNVLIGEDGRVRVLDFGLATSAPSTSSDEDHERPPAPLEIAGTPAYMAPEQHEGGVGDARTDLFAFCVTGWEALSGMQPFPGHTLDAIAMSKAAGPPVARRSSAPRWLFDVIRRGLAVDPHERPSSMSALLAELQRRRNRRRNLWIAAATTSAVAGLLAFAWLRGGDARACIADGEAQLSAVWNEDARSAGRAAFEAAEVPYAADAWVRVDSVIEDRVSTWRQSRAQACAAAVGDRDDGIEHAAAALLCLDRQLDDLAARVDLMAAVDRDMMKHAAAAAERMPSADRCLDAAWIAREPQGTAATIDAELLRARVQNDLGHFDDAMAAARVAAGEAEAAGDHYRHARALYMMCRALVIGRREHDIDAACTEAWVAAERAGADGLAISAMTEVLGVAKLDQAREAERLSRLIGARIDGLAPDERDWNLSFWYALTMAQRLRAAGQYREARVEAQRAYDTVSDELGSDDNRVVSPLNELALVADELGEFEVARGHFMHAHQLLVSTRGATHPDVISLDNNIAGLEISLGQHELALDRLARVLAAKEAVGGERSTWLITTLYQLVEANAALGRGEDAVAYARRSLAIAEGVFGHDATDLISPLVSLAIALQVADRCEEALRMLERGDALEQAAGARDVEVATLGELARGQCQERLGRTHDAGASFERVIAQREEVYGASSRAVAEALLARAQWERAHGSVTRARQLLARAHDICRATEGDPALGERVAAELTAVE